MKKKANSSISLKKIRLSDDFWGKYVKLVKEVIIPYQWDILNDRLEGIETSHCIENFRIAAGEKQGDFYGAVFQDTDVAKWIEAVGFVLCYGRDDKLEALADEVIDLIGRAQQPDGYLNTYYTIKMPGYRWTNLEEGHELYTAGHMIEGAVAYYEATGKRKFLDIVCRFADLICDTFGPEDGKIHGYPGHQEIEIALVKLYRVTGKRCYLDMAKYFIDIRGVGEHYFLQEEKSDRFRRIFPEFNDYDPKYSQSHLPVREQKTAEGHAVRAVYMYSAMADLSYEYDDRELLEVCDRLWSNMIRKRMYITGSIGSSGLLERFTTDYDLPNDCNYSESCASIGLAMFGKRMADIKKDASYMDVVELALYNTVLAGIAMDGKSFFYVNPLEVWPDNCIPRTSREHVKPVRQKWYGVACCPPNITRTLASLGQYIYFQEENSIYVNLFISNLTQIEFDGNRFTLEMESDFPWDGKISFRIRGEKSAAAKFYFRIPGYAKKYRILRNGQEENFGLANNYAKIEGIFKEDLIEIDFDIPATFVRANPRVRADAGKVALMKGPVVYCFEETDNGKNLASLYVSARQELAERKEDKLFDGCVVLKVHGKKISESGWDDKILYHSGETVLEDIELTAIPYCYWGNREKGEMYVWIKEIL